MQYKVGCPTLYKTHHPKYQLHRPKYLHLTKFQIYGQKYQIHHPILTIIFRELTIDI